MKLLLCGCPVLTQGKGGWYVAGGFFLFSLFINLLGAAGSRSDAKLRTVFSEFR